MATAALKAYNPLILRFHRLLEAFSKSDDERDFYLDRDEGFLVYIDLDKTQEEIDAATIEILSRPERYVLVPKMTFYEIKRLMEGFVNEKIYDIDVKEKLLDIIQSKEARENFLEFIYDHLSELDKWQQYYKERSRIRIIEWLRIHQIQFVFEEDLEIPYQIIEKVRLLAFEAKASKDVQNARELLYQKAGSYYSIEATFLKPRRGRPPKQIQKIDIEVQFSSDIYTAVPAVVRPFLFTPDFSSHSITFSTKFDTEADLIASLKGFSKGKVDAKLEVLSQRLESLRQLSDKLSDIKGSDERLFRGIPEVSLPKPIAAVQVTSEVKEGGGISSLFQNIVPKKRGRPTKGEEVQEKQKAKRVTQIQYKKK